MLKVQRWQLGWSGISFNTVIVPLGLGMALLTATTPAFAQMTTKSIRVPYRSGVVVERGYYGGVSQPTGGAPYIYGSPISTPMPVNPSTGLMPNRSDNYYNSYPVNSYPARGRVDNSTLINPTLVNPRIDDSTLINPVIVNEPVYRVPVYERRSPSIYFSN
jgi:hypothetical protein